MKQSGQWKMDSNEAVSLSLARIDPITHMRVQVAIFVRTPLDLFSIKEPR